jgi:hypothetical protein
MEGETYQYTVSITNQSTLGEGGPLVDVTGWRLNLSPFALPPGGGRQSWPIAAENYHEDVSLVAGETKILGPFNITIPVGYGGWNGELWAILLSAAVDGVTIAEIIESLTFTALPAVIYKATMALVWPT